MLTFFSTTESFVWSRHLLNLVKDTTWLLFFLSVFFFSLFFCNFETNSSLFLNRIIMFTRLLYVSKCWLATKEENMNISGRMVMPYISLNMPRWLWMSMKNQKLFLQSPDYFTKKISQSKVGKNQKPNIFSLAFKVKIFEKISPFVFTK